MDDLLQELREYAAEGRAGGNGLAEAPARCFDDAADEIERLRSGWLYIVSCPTDDSEWEMRLEDGTTYIGRWSTAQSRWQRRSDPIDTSRPERVVEGESLKAERSTLVVWSNLPEGVHPVAYRSAPVLQN